MADESDVDFDADADNAKALFSAREGEEDYASLLSSCGGGKCKVCVHVSCFFDDLL